MRDIKNYSLLEHNTFGIDAKCERFIEYASNEEAQMVAEVLRGANEYLIIGGGSNLLLTKDYQGIVVTPATMQNVADGIEILNDGVSTHNDGVSIRCWAGLVFDDVVAFATNKGLYDMENLSLIPGEVGASAVQNIGAYGAEAKDVIESIEAVEIATGKVVTISAADCNYAYRQSIFKHEWKNKYLITHVTYRLSSTFTPHLDYGNIRTELEKKGIAMPTAQQLRDTIIEIRNEKLPDPKVEGNAGSFFMNPIVDKEKFQELAARYEKMPHYVVEDTNGEVAYKIPAGWMIDQCGWKGKTLGKAGVHAKQALVLVNRGGATGADITHLMKTIQDDVKRTFGIELHPEVNII